MTADVAGPVEVRHHLAWHVLAGGVVVGVVAAVAGTIQFPLVGTFLFTIPGVAVGAVLGLLDGELSRLADRLHSRVAGHAVFTAITGVLGWLCAAQSAGSADATHLALGAAAGLGIGVLIVAIAAPLGADPKTGSEAAQRLARVGRWVLIALCCGSAVGAVAGLIVGLHVAAATSPFAMVEAAILASVPSALLGAVGGVLRELGHTAAYIRR